MSQMEMTMGAAKMTYGGRLYYRIIGLLTGVGMTVGGLVGLWKAFGVIFPG